LSGVFLHWLTSLRFFISHVLEADLSAGLFAGRLADGRRADWVAPLPRKIIELI